jgi:D-psicose/D-tagatose/L-ribulose 3-epimerase
MRLAISNIAWEPAEDEAVAALLNRHGLDAIDIAPSKYFPEPSKATGTEISRVRDWWDARGVEITGMQALLFGTTGLNVFGPPAVQDALLGHLSTVCQIGGGLGAPRLVFGSPRNRDRTGLSDDEAHASAVPFFRRLGDIAAAHNVIICLEPNPPRYGANFMTTSMETAVAVAQIAHPAIRMQFDTGAIAINGEDPATVLQEYASFVGHVHASEPDLLPLGDGGTDHNLAAHALAQHLPGHLVCVEMVATKDEPHVQSIDRALTVARRHYGVRT